MCQLLETIRVENGVAQHLYYHQQRVNRSANGANACLESYVRTLQLPADGRLKLRMVYDQHGIVEHTITPYAVRPIATLRLVVDDHIVYDRKTTDRSAIERLMNLRDNCDDIIIVRRGLITDSSFANLALFDGQHWVTPSEPLLEGTCRARLLHCGVLTERPISVESLGDYCKLQLINSMLDFDPTGTNSHIHFDRNTLVGFR